jgi:hypothetical protein
MLTGTSTQRITKFLSASFWILSGRNVQAARRTTLTESQKTGCCVSASIRGRLFAYGWAGASASRLIALNTAKALRLFVRPPTCFTDQA